MSTVLLVPRAIWPLPDSKDGGSANLTPGQGSASLPAASPSTVARADVTVGARIRAGAVPEQSALSTWALYCDAYSVSTTSPNADLSPGPLQAEEAFEGRCDSLLDNNFGLVPGPPRPSTHSQLTARVIGRGLEKCGERGGRRTQLCNTERLSDAASHPGWLFPLAFPHLPRRHPARPLTVLHRR